MRAYFWYSRVYASNIITAVHCTHKGYNKYTRTHFDAENKHLNKHCTLSIKPKIQFNGIYNLYVQENSQGKQLFLKQAIFGKNVCVSVDGSCTHYTQAIVNDLLSPFVVVVAVDVTFSFFSYFNQCKVSFCYYQLLLFNSENFQWMDRDNHECTCTKNARAF